MGRVRRTTNGALMVKLRQRTETIRRPHAQTEETRVRKLAQSVGHLAVKQLETTTTTTAAAAVCPARIDSNRKRAP